jgi:predicted GH43/DUF377 family glycosyl hydrolase
MKTAAAAERFAPLLSPKLPEWAIGPFTKYEGNPILSPVGDGWESGFVYNPSVVKDGLFHMVYRAEDPDTSKFKYLRSEIGGAISDDGLIWRRPQAEPVIPATERYELPGGNEDPRMFHGGDAWYVWYTGYFATPGGGRDVVQCAARSSDLESWEKLGPRGRKNDCILVDPEGHAVKVDGKYVLFNDNRVGTSPDLGEWDYVETDLRGQVPAYLELCSAVTGIPGREDDIVMFIAVRPDAGLKVLIDEYALAQGDYRPDEVAGSNHYVLVEALLSRSDPTTVRELSPAVLCPTEPYEIEGRNGPGTPFPVVFMNSGLILHEGLWRLYYGGADAVCCAATAEAR